MSWVAVAIGGASVVSGLLGSRSSEDAANTQAASADAATAEQRRQFDLIRGDTAPYRQIGQNALADISREFGYTAPANALINPATQPNSYVPRPVEPVRPTTGGVGPFIQYARDMANYRQQLADWEAGQGGISGSPPSGYPISAPGYSGTGFTASPDYGFRRSEGMRGIENSFAARGGALSGNALRALNEFNSNLASSEYGNWFNRRSALAGTGQTAVGTSGNAGMQTASNVGNALMAGGNARASGIMGQGEAWNNALQGGLSNWLLYRNLNRTPYADLGRGGSWG